ncbi:MAG: 5-formyltetrahydrofolate cyclo-ligase [Armatimonadetes bacterium]|nr:5-formyltetrahydrofolate cyclo-ligase [Akkermansiaceae bacterium]
MINQDDSLIELAAKLQKKRELRRDLRHRLLDGKGNSAVVVKKLAEYLIERPELKVVALFSALRGEVDLLPLLDVMERTWVFPKVKGEVMEFYYVKSSEKDLSPGAYGILEPKADLAKVDIEKVDLFLCPGLGFDRRGGRIGRGMGFYDRTLEKASPRAVKLGVCFDFQIVDEVEMEAHDVRMNGVIYG